MKLNVGCGARPLEGFVNTDQVGGHGVDKVFDAAHHDWPFSEETFDEVYAGCILPHILDGGDLEHFIAETHRVLKPGGRFVVTCPDIKYREDLGLSAFHHYRVITAQTFQRFAPGHDVRGLDRPPDGVVFRVARDERGWNSRPVGRDGRPTGVSKIAPRFWPMGPHKLGMFTHLFRRLRITRLLRGAERRITLVKETPDV